MTAPDQSVNQVDYIATLEEDLARESQARRLLTALLAQRTRTLNAYIDRFGDITAPLPEQPASPSTPAPASEATDG